MSAQPTLVASSTPLVDRVDRDFQPHALDALLDLDCEPLPQRIFERALLSPLREFLGKPGKGLRGALVEFAFGVARASHGRLRDAMTLPPELPQAIELLHAGSLIIDDIEDAALTRRGGPALHHVHGVPISLNAGNWLYFEAQSLVARVSLAPPIVLRLQTHTIETMLRCHHGQALDLSLRVVDLEQSAVPAAVRAVTQLKTGSLMELACVLGAVAGDAPERVQRALRRFGRELGVGLQMLDDLGSVQSKALRHKGNEDIRGLRPTWPWAWLAHSLSEDEYEALRNLAATFAGAASCEPVLDCMRVAPRPRDQRAAFRGRPALAARGPRERDPSHGAQL